MTTSAPHKVLSPSYQTRGSQCPKRSCSQRGTTQPAQVAAGAPTDHSILGMGLGATFRSDIANVIGLNLVPFTSISAEEDLCEAMLTSVTLVLDF